MRNSLRFLAVVLVEMALFSSCSQHPEEIASPPTITNQQEELNTDQKRVIQRFKVASYVLEEMFKDNRMRYDFNSFIRAKLKKTHTDEELTFREIFNARNIDLEGISSDFLKTFKSDFLRILISGDFVNNQKYPNLKFKNELEAAQYFGLKKAPLIYQRPQLLKEEYEIDDDGIPYEVYYPYSENFVTENTNNYTITHNPLVTKESNTGKVYSGTNNTLLKEVTVDDEYAYKNPTYILTFDDGLQLSDFKNGKKPISAERYLVYLTDDNYDLIKIADGGGDSGGVSVSAGECNTELRVKDGRWTKLHQNYGLFEGAIEFAVAISRDVSDVSIPTQNEQSNPIISINKKAQAWSYKKIKRRDVKKMKSNPEKFVSFGMYVSPWCPGDEDKMMFLYEYDKPNLFSSHAKEISEALGGIANLIKDSATRSRVSSFISIGLSPILKATLEGTAKSRVEHYGLIGSDAVWQNHKKPSNGTIPTNINGYRLYGNNEVNVTFEMD